MKPSPAAAVAATILAATVWGTSFSVNDIGLAHVGPATFAFLRFAMAAAVLLAVAAWMGRLDAKLPRRPLFWALAVANAAGFLLQYYGQTFTTPARTALFVNCSAFTVALLERFWFGLRLGAGRLTAIVGGFGGAALLITRGDPASLEGGQLIGDLLTLASGLAWSVYFVMTDRVIGTGDSWNVLAWTFAATAAILAPTVLFDAAPLAVAPEGWAPVLYTGLVTTALAFGLWAWGLRAIRPTTSAVLLLVEILVASLVSVALGREAFGLWELAGAALLVAAVVGMTLLAPRDEGVVST